MNLDYSLSLRLVRPSEGLYGQHSACHGAVSGGLERRLAVLLEIDNEPGFILSRIAGAVAFRNQFLEVSQGLQNLFFPLLLSPGHRIIVLTEIITRLL